MNVTHIKSFGHLGFVHVIVDTFSHALWATCQTGEVNSHVKWHCLECFATLWIPHTMKTENGPAYSGKRF
jgi:hypothetical protein